MIEEKEDKQGSATATLLCIPDISWFIEFMGNTDFEISSKLMP